MLIRISEVHRLFLLKKDELIESLLGCFLFDEAKNANAFLSSDIIPKGKPLLEPTDEGTIN